MRLATSIRCFAVALLPLVFWGAAAVATPPAAQAPTAVSAADAKAAQRVIQAQLNAFAADDAKAAYAHAAPAIRARFGSAAIFMAMVRHSYPMVYRPTNVVFQKPVAVGAELLQPVVFTDADGDEWLASYRMQRQKNRSWRVNGCEVAPVAGRSA